MLESLRNSFDLLMVYLPRWMAISLDFEDHPDPASLALFWGLLGLGEAWVPLLVHLHLRWDRGRLLVAKRFVGDDNCLRMVSTCLLRLFRFSQWTSSRWCSVGSSCRCLVGSIFAGLQGLVGYILADPASSKYYLGGWSHFDSSIMKMCCVIVSSSGVSEHVLASILKDDRVALNIDKLYRIMREESDRALGLSDAVLSLLAGMCDSSFHWLRDQVACSVAIQVGYAGAKLRPALGLPWSLGRGDIVHNLEQLARGPRPSDPVALKIFDLMRLKYPMVELKAAIGLLLEAGWTTTCTEQGHSTASKIVRSHPRYGRATLTARAMVQQSVCLFRGLPVISKMNASKRRLRRLRSKRFGSISGKHAWCSSLMRVGRSRQALYRDMPANYVKRIIRDHGKAWNNLPQCHQQQFHGLAKEMRDERQAANARRLDIELETLQALEAKHRAEEEETSRLRLGACRFTISDKVEFDSLYNSDVWTRKRIDALRAEAVEPVGPPAAPIVEGLDSFCVDGDRPARMVPPWARWIAVHREFFRRCVVRFEGAPVFYYFRVVYATQSPTLVCLCKCLPCDDPEPHFDARSLPAMDPKMFDHNFEYDLGSMAFSDEPLLCTPTSISILQDAVFRRNRRLGCDGRFVSMAEVQQWLPPPSAAAAAQPSRVHPKQPASEPWMQDPLMWEFIRDAGKAKNKIHLKQPRHEEENSADEDEAPNLSLDEEIGALELWDRRAELDREEGIHDGSFSYTLRGGGWTKAHLGVAFDSLPAFTAAGRPRLFCAKFSLGQTSIFSISKYGEDLCISLCKAWVHRMCFLYRLWVDDGASSEYRFREEDLVRFAPVPEVQVLAHGASAAFRERLNVVNTIRPRAV